MFGRGKDPTEGWPRAGAPPSIDLERRQVGPLRLGDPLEGAKSLGRPDRVRGPANGGNRVLEYAAFELDFRDGRLACVKFDLDGPASVSVGGLRLSRATKPLEARAWFGEPASDTTDGGALRWIDFERAGATLALEFDAGGLACVQLYAEGFA